MAKVEMELDSIRCGIRLKGEQSVILKEKAAERYLPIWIGPFEADAIAVALLGNEVPRPQYHDLLCTVINELGATINSIVVSDLRDNTFFSTILLNVNGEQMAIDSRPSDALAVAVRSKVPIYVEEAVLAKAGIDVSYMRQKD